MVMVIVLNQFQDSGDKSWTKDKHFFGDKFKENNVPMFQDPGISREQSQGMKQSRKHLQGTWKHAIQKVQGSQS